MPGDKVAVAGPDRLGRQAPDPGGAKHFAADGELTDKVLAGMSRCAPLREDNRVRPSARNHKIGCAPIGGGRR